MCSFAVYALGWFVLFGAILYSVTELAAICTSYILHLAVEGFVSVFQTVHTLVVTEEFFWPATGYANKDSVFDQFMKDCRLYSTDPVDNITIPFACLKERAYVFNYF